MSRWAWLCDQAVSYWAWLLDQARKPVPLWALWAVLIGCLGCLAEAIYCQASLDTAVTLLLIGIVGHAVIDAHFDRWKAKP